MNISEAEYAAKYETYLQTVRENRKLRLQRDVPTTTQRFYTFAHLSNKANTYNTVSTLYWIRIHTRCKTVVDSTNFNGYFSLISDIRFVSNVPWTSYV